MEDLAELVDRVSRLEHSLRSAHRFAGGLAVALCSLISIAAMQGKQQSQPDDLRVQKLIADTIEVRKEVTIEGEGGSAMLSRSGLMVVSKLGGVVVGSNSETGDCYVKLLRGAKLESGPTMVDAASLGITSAGAALFVGGKDNKVILASDLKLGTTMMFIDERGRDRVRVTVPAEGSPDLQMKDAAGKERVTLGSQVLQGVDGKPLRLPESSFTLWDEVGRCVHRAGSK
jgi:hypothetical protein